MEIPDELIEKIRQGIKWDKEVGEPICSTAAAARELIDWVDKNVC